MRRGRSLKDFRSKLQRNRAARVHKAKDTSLKLQKNRMSRDRMEQIKSAKRRIRQLANKESQFDFSQYISHYPLNITEFAEYGKYVCSLKKKVHVCHVIESVGLGGAQTMMMELINGLNRYYGEHIKNYVVYLHYKKQSLNKKLYKSYGVIPQHITHNQLKDFCKKNDIDIVLHHRIAHSKCIKKHLPDIKYVLLNHTWNFLHKIKDFLECDAYVSVCNFLQDKTPWPEFIHSTRKFVILNGIENDYVDDLEPCNLSGTFKTGRCHRLVPSKFDISSIKWMDKHIIKMIPGFKHYLMGTSQSAKEVSNKSNAVEYMGTIYNRNQKMSIIKALDTYFYETFENEGASVAILESLACGVPVMCKPLGGNSELVINKVNGHIVVDRSGYMKAIQYLYSNPSYLDSLKKQTVLDFQSRLHVRHTACKYMQLFEFLCQ